MKFSRKSFDDFYFNFLVGLEKKTKILDYGCGEGRLLNKISKNGFFKHSGFDVARLWPREYNKYCKVIDVDEKLIGDYDVIFSNQVFEHVEKKSLYLSNIYSLLNYQGKAIISFPLKEIIFEPHIFLPFCHRFKPDSFYNKFLLFILGIFKFIKSKSSISVSDWVANRVEFLTKDVYYISGQEFESMASSQGFRVTDCSIDVIKYRYSFVVSRLILLFGGWRLVGSTYLLEKI